MDGLAVPMAALLEEFVSSHRCGDGVHRGETDASSPHLVSICPKKVCRVKHEIGMGCGFEISSFSWAERHFALWHYFESPNSSATFAPNVLKSTILLHVG